VHCRGTLDAPWLVPLVAKIEEQRFGRGYEVLQTCRYLLNPQKVIIGSKTVSGILRAGRWIGHSWSSGIRGWPNRWFWRCVFGMVSNEVLSWPIIP